MVHDADGVGCFSSSSGSTKRWNYDVFLSFRGDTRINFTDHLYEALRRKGLKTFRDKEELRRGQSIRPSLLQAIEESQSAIVVLSPCYASSTWCLDELQKIITLKEESSLQVFPIFYSVDPSDVKKQKGSFAEPFKNHEERFTQDKLKVQRWRDALEEVATISGWHSKNWYETKLIESIAQEIMSKLLDKWPSNLGKLVGIEPKLDELESMIASELEGVRFIGIWGIGGLGKTTLARAFYEQKRKNFEIHCFLYNISEVYEKDGLISLQRKLLLSLDKRSMEIGDCYEEMIKKILADKKILLVLDDVSNISQLESLAPERGWCSEGSIIIITTRNKHLLSSHGVSAMYDIKFLSYNESLELFLQKAFKGDQPNEDYLDLARAVIEYVGGLPLALKVLGSFLCKRTIAEWKDALAKFKKIPLNDILKILKMSFDGLDDMEKTIFLDIACFFNGMVKDHVIQILETLDKDLHPQIGIRVLIDKSLITNYEGHLWVHEILQNMGKYIVSRQSPYDAYKCSRILSLEDANDVLEENKETEAIRGIKLTLEESCDAFWDPDAFLKMSNLKLLIISSHSNVSHCQLNLPHGLKSLSSELKIIEWERYPLFYLPSETQLQKLVDLKMRYSKLKEFCTGKQVFERLKFMDLSYSIYLIKTPNFDEIPHLQNLIVEGCINLVEVHPSLGHHKNLVTVNLKGCKSMKTLPSKFEMKCLETLILSGCLKIRRLPEFGKSMKCLSKLDAENIGITKLPQSLVNLCQLVVLNLRNCKNLVCLPNEIQCMKSIKILNISGCSKLSRLPENLNENVALEGLDASGTAIEEVPSSIIHLKNLRLLSFSGCTGQAQSSSSNFSSFLTRFFRLTTPSISTGLLLPPSLLGLSNLMQLNLSYCNLSDESLPSDINALSSLVYLFLSGNNFVNLPVGFFSNLLKLDFVNFCHCTRLQSLPRLPSNLVTTWAYDCPSMKSILDSQQLWKIFERFEYQEGLNSNSTWPFVMYIGGSEVPSWFHNQNCFCDDAWHFKPNVSFITDINDHHHSSKWLGIAVCLLIEGHYDASASFENYGNCSDVNFICRNAGDKIRNPFRIYRIHEGHNDHNQRFLFFFPCVVKKRLQISFRILNGQRGAKFEIRKCGWRVLCKEDVEAWRRTRGEGCSSSNNDSDNYHSLNELGATETTSDSSYNSQFVGNEEEEDDGDQSNIDGDIQMPSTKRRKLK